MSSNDNSNPSVESFDIEAHESLVEKVIVDQAGDLEKGWREAAQNAIDGGADTFNLDYGQQETVFSDDGDGVDLSQEQGRKLLSQMGNTSKADDEDSIGRFGVGVGQVVAKGQTLFMSGDSAMLFDIKGWGMEVRAMPVSTVLPFLEAKDTEWHHAVMSRFGRDIDDVDGFCGMVYHYQDEVPEDGHYNWTGFRRSFKDRFKYLSAVKDTEIILNGDTISEQNPTSITSFGAEEYSNTFYRPATGDVHFGVYQGDGPLTVYSGGIKVCTVDSRGIQGQVVTERNLELNFARNEIKSGCPRWQIINDKLDDIRRDLFDSTQMDDELCDEARRFMSEDIIKQGRVDANADRQLFKTVNETFVSFNDIQSRDEIGFAAVGDKAAEQLVESYGMIVLAEHDLASGLYKQDAPDNFDVPEVFDPSHRAEANGVFTSAEQTHDDELSPMQRKKLGVARYMANLMGSDRQIQWGESDVAHGWTDGKDYITLTDSCAQGPMWAQWIPDMAQTLIHEMAHRNPSRDSASHGVMFDDRFRSLMEDGGKDALSQTQADISRQGLGTIAEVGNHNGY